MGWFDGVAFRSIMVTLGFAFLVGASATASPPDVAIFVVSGGDEIAKQFSAIVAEVPGGLTARVYSSLEEVVRSDAELVIMVVARSRNPFPQDVVDGMRKKKVIGVGYGAAQLFGQLELEINGGACAHFSSNIQLQPQNSQLLGPQSKAEAFASFNGPATGDHFAMHVPRGSADAYVVDVIARNGNDLNYAPIVKQNNFVMVGLSASPEFWTPEYRSFFQKMVANLKATEQVPFSKAEFPLLAPGDHPIALGQGRSTERLSSQTYHFRFKKPTTFTATLQHNGSNNMMMLFMGKKERLHWTREDARNGEPLSIVINISAEDLERIGDNDWTLKVTNFDRDNPATCVLKVLYDVVP